MTSILNNFINLDAHPIDDAEFSASCRALLAESGVLVLKRFLRDSAIESIRSTGMINANNAYFTNSNHNVYLAPTDPAYSIDHPRNRTVVSSKGCITTDQIPAQSELHLLYHDDSFKSFLCDVLNETALHEYADPLSSINLHYAAAGQELGWHFDNSSFAITLLIQKPEAGGVFEYVKNARNAELGEMNFDLVTKVLDASDEQTPKPDGSVKPSQLAIEEGDLVLFRGRDAMHRVTPTIGDITRMLVVLAYNTEPGISLSESARQTFYGRLQ